MAAIGYPNFNGDVSYQCAGSLVSDLYVLTAAHCGYADRARPTVVRLGDLNLKLQEPELPELDIPIARFIGHPNYDKSKKQNDIALVQMNRPVTFTKFIRPACLWQTTNIPDAKAIATGWGHTEYAGHSSADMMKVQLDILDTGICTRAYEDGGFPVGDKQVCAGERYIIKTSFSSFNMFCKFQEFFPEALTHVKEVRMGLCVISLHN